MENKLPTPEQIQQNILNLRNDLRKSLDVSFEKNLEQIVGKKLTLEEKRLIVDNVTQELIEKVPNVIYEPIPIDKVGAGYQFEIFRIVIKHLQNQKFLSQQPDEKQFPNLLKIKDEVNNETFDLALEVSQQTQAIKEDLAQKWQTELHKTFDLNQSEAKNIAQDITNKAWLRLSTPNLALPTNASFQEKLTDLYNHSAEEVISKNNLPIKPLREISAHIASESTLSVEPIIYSPLFDNSRNYYQEVRHEIYNSLAQKGVKGEDALKIADQTTKEVVDKSINFINLPDNERITETQKATQFVLEKNFEKISIVPHNELKPFAETINKKTSGYIKNFQNAPVVNPITDLFPPHGQAFEILFAAFDPNKSTKYFEEHILKIPLEYFVKSVLKEPSGSFEEWILGKGQNVVLGAIVGPQFATQLKLSLFKEITSEKIQYFITRYTSNLPEHSAYRMVHGIPRLPQNDIMVRELQRQLMFMQTFEQHHPIGKLVRAFNKFKKRLAAPMWNIKGFDILELKYQDMLLLAISDPQKIPEVIVNKLKDHIIRITVGKVLNTIGLKTGLYKVVYIPGTSVKIIVSNWHNLVLSPIKGAFTIGKKLVTPIIKKVANSSVGLFIKVQLKKLANSRLGLVVKAFIGTIIKIGSKLLAFISGIFTVVGIILVIRDIIKAVVPLFKKVLEKIALAMLGMYLLLAQLGIWGLIGGMVGGIAGAVIGFMLGGPIGMVVGYVIGSVVGGLVLSYLIPALSAIFSAISSALATILSTLATITTTIFSLATVPVLSVALAAGTIVTVTFTSSTPPPEAETRYIEINVTASPETFATPTGTIKFKTEIKSNKFENTRELRLENVSIKETMSVFTKDETKEVQFNKKDVNKDGCKGINDSLTSVGKIEPKEICSYSFNVNIQETIGNFNEASAQTEDYTIALLIVVNADVYDVYYNQILTYASEETKRSGAAFVKIGAGGGQPAETKPGETQPSKPGKLPNVAELPSGWPTKSGTIFQGPNTCKTLFNLYCKGDGKTHGLWPKGWDDTQAIDIGSGDGDEVRTTHTGYLIYKSIDNGSAAIVESNYDGKRIITMYLHLKWNHPKNGNEIVQKGDVIGYEDNTGDHTTGTHLHYRLDPSSGYTINQILPTIVPEGCYGKTACHTSF